MYTVTSFLGISMFLVSSFETDCLEISLNNHNTFLSRKSIETFESRGIGNDSVLSFSKMSAAGLSISPLI